MSASSSFDISVSEFSTARLYGACVHTDMTKAGTDCPQLWAEQIMPHMDELPGGHTGSSFELSYGLSFIVDMEKGVFDYWAAVPLLDMPEPPSGFMEVTLPAGLYAGCRVDSLDQLGAGYEALYAWVTASSELELNMAAPSLEKYGQEYAQSGALEIHVPVNKK